MIIVARFRIIRFIFLKPGAQRAARLTIQYQTYRLNVGRNKRNHKEPVSVAAAVYKFTTRRVWSFVHMLVDSLVRKRVDSVSGTSAARLVFNLAAALSIRLCIGYP